MNPKGGIIKYIRKAFFFKWNMLALFGGFIIVLASHSGRNALAILAGVEFFYLAALVARPRFRDAVDAEEFKKKRKKEVEAATRKAEQLFLALKREDRSRFKNLKRLCGELKQLSSGLRDGSDAESKVVSEMRLSAINELLWVYLKLLYTKNALEKYFETINENALMKDIEQIKRKLNGLGPKEDDAPDVSKRRVSLDDTMATSESRMDNYRRAKSNYEYVQLELDRLYSKITNLSESNINRHDPGKITREVNDIASSVQDTEKAIKELDYITGLDFHEDSPPALLDAESAMTSVKNPRT